MFHTATKLVVITEHFLSRHVCEIIEAEGGKGYTMISAGGKGLHHLHPTQDQATVVEGFDNLKIEVVVKERKRAETMAERLVQECFRDYPGVLYLQTVEICRPERF